MTGRHEPTPEFRTSLEHQVARELRREARLRSPAGGGRRRLRTVALALVALALGAVAGAAPAQVQEGRQREALILYSRAEAEVAGVRLQLARAAFQEAQRKHELGMMARASLAAAEAELREAEANLARVRLNQEEIRASATPPRNEISAPLVASRDFVSERLRLELEAAQARIALVRDTVAEVERRVNVGLAQELPLQEARTELARQEGELRVLAERLRLRREFLERGLPVADVERRVQQLELQQRVESVQGRYALAAERLRHLRELHAVGQAEALELARAEVEVLERAAELAAIQRRLELLRSASREEL